MAQHPYPNLIMKMILKRRLIFANGHNREYDCRGWNICKRLIIVVGGETGIEDSALKRASVLTIPA